MRMKRPQDQSVPVKPAAVGAPGVPDAPAATEDHRLVLMCLTRLL